MISYNPFDETEKPKYIKADLFSYKFTPLGKNSTDWWSRKYIRNYFPTVNYEQLEAYIKDLEWSDI